MHAGSVGLFMYIRFISPERASRGRGCYGLFQAALDLVYDTETPDFIYYPVREELDWFNEHLPAPKGRSLCVRSRKVWRDDGICWFRDDAGEMIAHAHLLARLVREWHVPIALISTRNPGQILYKDAYQIVAKPDANTPVGWR